MFLLVLTLTDKLCIFHQLKLLSDRNQDNCRLERRNKISGNDLSGYQSHSHIGMTYLGTENIFEQLELADDRHKLYTLAPHLKMSMAMDELLHSMSILVNHHTQRTIFLQKNHI